MSSTTRLAQAATAMLAAVLLVLTVPTPAPARTVGPDGEPITNQDGVTFGVLAHRGGADEAPENSVEAYTASVAAGFDGIEADIVFTRDGRGVMSHNDKLPTRCTQAGKSIHKLTYAQVAEVRCANLKGKKVVPIPTFEQLAEILKTNPEVGLTLDIKSYSGQSASGKRTWADKAMRLVQKHGLLERTKVLTFYWSDVLPTIRKYAKDNYVQALDNRALDLDRVRLAAKLGADAYGIKMKHTSAFLARYVKSKGMDSTPWEVRGDQIAFTIHYGGRTQLLMTDSPTKTRAALVGGRINLDPVPKPVTTKLKKAVTISKATYKADKRYYPAVLGKAIPSSAGTQLDTVTVAITVTKGPGKGSVSVGAASEPLANSVRAALPKGTKTITLKAPLGDGGKLRISTTRKVKLTVKVTAYTRIQFS